MVIRELTGRALLRRAARASRSSPTAARAAVNTMAYTRARSSGWRGPGLRRRAKRRKRLDLGGQGQRARRVAAVARGGDAGGPKDIPTCQLDHVLVDNCAMALVARAHALRHDRHREHLRRHPVGRGGHPGRARWACCRRRASAERAAAVGLYEPVHGTAPDIAGQGDRQPDRGDPVGGDAAAVLARPGRRRGSRGRGGRCGCSSRGTARGTSTRPAPSWSGTTEMGDLIVRELEALYC